MSYTVEVHGGLSEYSFIWTWHTAFCYCLIKSEIDTKYSVYTSNPFAKSATAVETSGWCGWLVYTTIPVFVWKSGGVTSRGAEEAKLNTFILWSLDHLIQSWNDRSWFAGLSLPKKVGETRNVRIEHVWNTWNIVGVAGRVVGITGSMDIYTGIYRDVHRKATFDGVVA